MRVKKSIKTRNSLLLTLAAVIWGISFVIQSIGGKQVGAYTFNSFRMLIGAFFVFLMILIFDRLGVSHRPETKEEKKELCRTGLVCAAFLAVATNLQQVALNLGIPVGKSGFLTACYILLVPILGLLFHDKCGWNIWIAVVIALAGLYLLCMTGAFRLELRDLLTLSCAVAFAFQIITIDHHGGGLDGLRLSLLQFLFTGLFSLVPALIFEIIPYAGGFGAWLSLLASGKIWLSLLYMGVLSCGVAYTLQIIGMRGLDPTLSALLMSLESVFSLFAGWLFLHEKMSGRELLGCFLMFLAICLAQIDFPELRKVRK